MMPEYTTTSDRLNTRLALSTILPVIAPAAAPAPICNVPAEMMVLPE